MYWSLALAALWFTTTALAQGSVGGDESVCSASPFVYKGCYDDTNNGRHVGFNWQLSSSTSDAKYFPGFTGSGNMTVDICLQACRGHGFKWAALYYGQECYCSADFPLPVNPSNTINGPVSPVGSAPGTPTSASACGSACSGNGAQICGGGGAASLYMDPSYSNNTVTASDPGRYQYFGCYSNGNAGPMYISSLATNSTVNCVSYCGSIGYAYSARSGPDTNSGSTCACGSEIQSGLQLPETSCGTYCNGTTGAK